jgi:nicotinate-nucleotide adenylyltransferase
MRLGILGGTFDPPHNGHLLIAGAAQRQVLLDRVLFAPVGIQPLKQDQPVTPAGRRAAMVQLMIAGKPDFELSRIDLDRPGPHFTVDTLRIASGLYPGAQIWFIMGADSLADLLRWRDPQGILDLARLAVVRRPGFDPDWAVLDAALPDLHDRIDWIDAQPIDIAASDLQRRIRGGESIQGLVPQAVAEYIAAWRLYE